MTSTAWQSAALERIIMPWVAKVAEVFRIIVAIILANAGNVRTTLHELSAHILARRLSPEFRNEARIGALFVNPWAPEPLRGLMTVDLHDATGSVLFADVGGARGAEEKVMGPVKGMTKGTTKERRGGRLLYAT